MKFIPFPRILQGKGMYFRFISLRTTWFCRGGEGSGHAFSKFSKGT